MALIFAGFATTPAAAAASLESFLARERPQSFHPRADRFGKPAGKLKRAPLYRGEKLLGYVFLNSDIVGSIGFSGKPIQILIGLNPKGVITGAKLVKHAEPIVLVGIPEKKIRDFIAGYVGKNVFTLAKAVAGNNRSVDIVSGATVTIMVIDDSIVRAALKMARVISGRAVPRSRSVPPRSVDMKKSALVDWKTLLGNGSVRRLILTVGDVNAAYARAGQIKALIPLDEAKPGAVFIEMYAAPVSIPTIGRSLLGDAEYNNLRRRLKPGQHALLLAGRGLYSFKGSGYVRGGIFDRIHLIQGETSVRFRDKHHKRIGALAAAGAAGFREISLFRIPVNSGFRADRPWRIQLLVSRPIGPLDKAFQTFDLRYTPPLKYFEPVVGARDKGKKPAVSIVEPAPLWQRLWERKIVEIVVLVLALGVLTFIFFFQNWFVRNRKRADGVRLAFLVFTTVYLGFVTHAQLSIVNVLSFSNSLLTGFKWEYFLADPMIFILWASVAGSLPFWGRGPYCGWLCPFGALQELVNRLAKLLKVPQFTVPWGLHERLWPLKYIIFMVILGLSFYSIGLGEKVSEIEPFKTVIILNFVREWWYVLFAVALLAAGLFVERFFCRYLCPLGAALALPGRMRMFEWLRRYKECGSPCQTCAKQCMVQAIHPTGQINPNECIYCLHCQQVYYDDHLCPVMVERRERRERRQRLSSDFGAPESAGAKAGPAEGKKRGAVLRKGFGTTVTRK